MSIVSEFKEFILKGNMIDLAVGLVIGAAFSHVVKTLVDTVIMPPTAFILGGVDLSEKRIALIDEIKAGEEHPVYGNVADKDIPAVNLEWGAMTQALLELVIIGAAIFLVVKVINKMKAKQEAQPKDEPTPADVELLREIRDELRGGAPRRGVRPDRHPAERRLSGGSGGAGRWPRTVGRNCVRAARSAASPRPGSARTRIARDPAFASAAPTTLRVPCRGRQRTGLLPRGAPVRSPAATAPAQRDQASPSLERCVSCDAAADGAAVRWRGTPCPVPPARSASFTDSNTSPEWRNWHTRWIQNPLASRPCGFESHLRYFPCPTRPRPGRRGSAGASGWPCRTCGSAACSPRPTPAPAPARSTSSRGRSCPATGSASRSPSPARTARGSGRSRPRSAAARASKSAHGRTQNRVFIETTLVLGGVTKTIELSLARRADLRHRLLLGRAALSPEFLIDSGRTFLVSKPHRRVDDAQARQAGSTRKPDP